jgi:hypothetical protein
MKAYPACQSGPSDENQRTTLSSIILASLTLSVTTDVSRGDGLLMASRARRTAAMIGAVITDLCWDLHLKPPALASPSTSALT